MTGTRFVFETVGTRGDVAPLLAIAHQMCRRGHRVSLLAPAAFEFDAQQLGVPFVPISGQHLNSQPGENSFDSYYFPAYRPVVDFFEKAAARGEKPVVVNIDKTATSNLMCERYDLAGVRLYLSPFKIRSLTAPPWPYSQRVATSGRAALANFFRACDQHPGLLAHINSRRASLGLPAANSANPQESFIVKEACLFPNWYCTPAADWPRTLEMLGFPLPSSTETVPMRVSAFLDRGEPPIVFTTGTGVYDVHEFFAEARKCCALLKKRGIFLSPHLAGIELSDVNVLVVDYLELSLILRRTALLVHHGGIGTLARAMQAGIPQIISPLKYDQPDNARRIETLGVGARLERELLSGQNLALMAAQLLEQKRCRSRVSQAKERIVDSSALDDCAALLEKAALGTQGASREKRVA